MIISTATDVTGLLNALQTLVSGYNSLLTTITNQTQYNNDPTKKGGLANDTIAKNFINQIQQYTTKPITAADGSTFTLSQLGVKTNLDGSISIDTAVVDQISQNNQALLANVLSSRVDPTSGATVKGSIDQMIDLCNIITGPTSDFQTELTNTQTTVEQKISDDQTKLDEQMTATYNRYISQFTAMQSILNSTKSSQTSLTNMMTAWSSSMKG